MSVVESWLSRIGLNYAVSSFQERGITTPVQLMNLNFEDFDDLGVRDIIDRRSLFELIKKVKSAYHQNPDENTNRPKTTQETKIQERPKPVIQETPIVPSKPIIRQREPATNIRYNYDVDESSSVQSASAAIQRPRINNPIVLPKKTPLPSASRNAPDIQVIVRKRPISTKESNRGEMDVVECSGASVLVHEPKEKVDLTKYVEVHEYVYDGVFAENNNTTDLYQAAAKPLIDSVFAGSKATCFAYGQTGSGKTYTMMGDLTDPAGRNPGLYLLAAQDIFAKLEGPEYKNLGVCISFFEIYGGKIFDLLNTRKRLRHLEDAKKNVVIMGLGQHRVHDVSALMTLIVQGNETRSTGCTGANVDSSRSHAILQISLENNRTHKEVGRFSFIDLAGSERGADTTASDKQTRLEGAEINKSLLALKECIRAMYNTHNYTPFRASTLTQVLKDSLVGNCKTVMIATVSPSNSNVEHSLNTLRYAFRVKEIRKGDAVVAEDNIANQAVKTAAARERKTGRNYSMNPKTLDDYDEEEEEYADENDKRLSVQMSQSMVMESNSGIRKPMGINKMPRQNVPVTLMEEEEDYEPQLSVEDSPLVQVPTKVRKPPRGNVNPRSLSSRKKEVNDRCVSPVIGGRQQTNSALSASSIQDDINSYYAVNDNSRRTPPRTAQRDNLSMQSPYSTSPLYPQQSNKTDPVQVFRKESGRITFAQLNLAKKAYVEEHSKQLTDLLTLIDQEMIYLKSLDDEDLEGNGLVSLNELSSLLDQKMSILTDLKTKMDFFKQRAEEVIKQQ